MKVRTFQIFVFFIAVLIFSMPFTTLAQQNKEKVDAEIEAKRDAGTDFNIGNNILWFSAGFGLTATCAIAGCLIGPSETSAYSSVAPGIPDESMVGLGIGLAVGTLVSFIGSSVYSSTIPVKRLVGKSTEYVNIYTDTYRSEIRKHRITSTGIGAGCCIGISLIGVITD